MTKVNYSSVRDLGKALEKPASFLLSLSYRYSEEVGYEDFSNYEKTIKSDLSKIGLFDINISENFKVIAKVLIKNINYT